MKRTTIALSALLLLAAEPNKHHATCEEECQTSCDVSPAGSRRQFVCQNECSSRCYSLRAEHKKENR
jgi:hypothetical protein